MGSPRPLLRRNHRCNAADPGLDRRGRDQAKPSSVGKHPKTQKATLEIWQNGPGGRTAGRPGRDACSASVFTDDREPGGAIVWGPASAIAAAPRPFCWLVGLTSRSWPRRASEDPLLPNHVIPQKHLDPLPIHESDRRDFCSICTMADRQVVCSRARRDSEGTAQRRFASVSSGNRRGISRPEPNPGTCRKPKATD